MGKRKTQEGESQVASNGRGEEESSDDEVKRALLCL